MQKRDNVALLTLTLVLQYLPEVAENALSTDSPVVNVNLNQPMSEIRKLLSQYPIRCAAEKRWACQY